MHNILASETLRNNQEDPGADEWTLINIILEK
jgi:hypothetical protein